MQNKIRFIIILVVLSFSATIAYANFDLDVDDDGKTEALTDGLLVIRYLFGFSGESLVAGAVANNASRTAASDIEAYLNANEIQLDVDGDGEVAALTDGLLIIRSLFGFSGTSLSAGAIATNALRTDGPAVAAYLETITDSDNDNTNDAFDAFPLDATETVDTDGDSIGDNLDLDDDGNGVLDSNESGFGTVIDGYLSGTTVYVDLNWNFQLDSSEPKTISDDVGAFSFGGDEAYLEYFGEDFRACFAKRPIIVEVPIGAVDSDRGEVTEAFKLYLLPKANE